MSFEVLESSKPPANRRNAARHSVKKVMFEWHDAVFSSRLKEALLVTQRSIFLRASAREA
jgi:hypothetical protein